MKNFSIAGAALIALLLGFYLFISKDEAKEQITADINDISESLSAEPELVEYGIETDDFYICTEKIKKNQNLGEILNDFGIDPATINEIAEKSKPVFDVRKLREGKSYCIMKSRDSLEQVKYFIYEQDPVNYVVYEIGDSINVSRGQKEITTQVREVAGEIRSSLWNTLVENDLDPNIAIRLSEIYAWSIDFYHLQKGDQFKLIFDEEFVDGEKIGFGDVHAAWFQHSSRDFYAVWYEQDSIGDFFDQDANSLRKAFLKAPLKFSRISSRYNPKRFHPVLKRVRPHLGTDYAAPSGTPIYTVGDGTIIERGRKGGNGNYVKVRHNGTYTTQYLHMSRFESGQKVGSFVRQGEVIGYVGQTGLATGPHLCFRFWKNNKQVDPLKEELPPSEPIREDCMASYLDWKEQVVKRLDAIQLPEPASEAEAREIEKSEEVPTDSPN